MKQKASHKITASFGNYIKTLKKTFESRRHSAAQLRGFNSEQCSELSWDEAMARIGFPTAV